MLISLLALACGGPQETYIVPTGSQPKSLTPDSPENTTAPTVPTGEPGEDADPSGELPMGVDEGCGPTSNYATKFTLTPENSTLITGTITNGISESGPYLIDLVGVDSTQLYSIMCTQPQFEFRVPAENNVARLAVFEDADQNGPSQTDKQAISDLLTLDTKPISGLQISLGETQVEGFNFDGANPGEIPPPEAGEEEPPPPGEEDDFVQTDGSNPSGDIPPGDEASATPPTEKEPEPTQE